VKVYVYLVAESKHETFIPNVSLTPTPFLRDCYGNRLRIKKGWESGVNYKRGLVFPIDFKSNEEYLKDGTLALECEIAVNFTVAVNRMIKGNEAEESGEDTTHSTDMLNLLKNAEQYDSDLKIVCSDGEVACHSNILAARSSYFAAMLASGMREKRTGRIEKKYLKKSVCLPILQYIYTGKVDSSKMSVEMFEEADQMNMMKLKHKCCNHLINNINNKNCVQLVLVADRHADTYGRSLKNAVLKFISDNSEVSLRGIPSPGNVRPPLRSKGSVLINN